MRWRLVGCWCFGFSFHFVPQVADFLLQLLVFRDFSVQKTLGDSCLGGHAFGCEHVHVGGFFVAVSEISGFDPAFVDYGAKAVVGFAEADSQMLRDSALGGFGILLQVVEELVF